MAITKDAGARIALALVLASLTFSVATTLTVSTKVSAEGICFDSLAYFARGSVLLATLCLASGLALGVSLVWEAFLVQGRRRKALASVLLSIIAGGSLFVAWGTVGYLCAY